jgi:hypothetical protein
VFDYPTATALTDYLLAELAPAEPERVGDRALADIDRLAATLAALDIPAGEDGTHPAVTERLRDLLSNWQDRLVPVHDEQDVQNVGVLLQSASKDELLKFIDDELGAA